MIPLTVLLAVALAVVHIISGQLRFLDTIPRNRWLSMAGGVSVAYVFVHLLPELSAQQQAFEQSSGSSMITYLEHHAYLLALVGLAAFYGLERSAKLSRWRNRRAGKKDVASPKVFWLHIASFAAYNALIGYLLLHRESEDASDLLVYFFAMALHFVVNDHGLREHHKADYDRLGRWILAVAVVVGWGIGVVTELQPLAIAVLIAFLSGGIILNVLKEELPEERESRFWFFFLGAAIYAALLLLLA